MQFTKVAQELITDTNITSNEFRVYTYLLSLYNVEKECSFPSIETISEKLNISISTVKRSIKRLTDLSYIKVSKRKGLAGNYNIYQKLKHFIKNKTEKVENAAEVEEDQFDIPGIGAALENDNQPKKCSKKEEKQSKIDNHANVRLARSVTDVDKSNFAKIILTMADERLLREAIRNFKNKNGKNATFLIQLLVDEYYKAKVEFSHGMLNLLKSGLKGSFITQPI